MEKQTIATSSELFHSLPYAVRSLNRVEFESYNYTDCIDWMDNNVSDYGFLALYNEEEIIDVMETVETELGSYTMYITA